jgi:hypothetical protein
MAVNNIVKGDEMQLFLELNGVTKALGYATAHSFSRSAETQEVASKDHGLFPATNVTRISWSVGCDALYTDADYDALVEVMDAAQPIYAYFCHVSNYDTKGLAGVGEGTVSYWAGGAGYKGKVIVANLDGTFNNGENATFSMTLNGVGSLQKVTGISYFGG